MFSNFPTRSRLRGIEPYVIDYVGHINNKNAAGEDIQITKT